MRAATVPICDECWMQQEGDRHPVRLREPEPETCYACGDRTLSGIYTRRIVRDAQSQ